MANEVVYSGLGDLRLAKILNNEIQLLLADRFSLRNAPERSSTRATSPAAARPCSRSRRPGWTGYDLMTAVGSETTAASNVALTDAKRRHHDRPLRSAA
jgi:hypothetical protein